MCSFENKFVFTQVTIFVWMKPVIFQFVFVREHKILEVVRYNQVCQALDQAYLIVILFKNYAFV